MSDTFTDECPACGAEVPEGVPHEHVNPEDGPSPVRCIHCHQPLGQVNGEWVHAGSPWYAYCGTTIDGDGNEVGGQRAEPAPAVDPDCLIVRNGLNPEHVCHDTGATLREGERCWGATKVIAPREFDVGDKVTYRNLPGVIEWIEGVNVGVFGEHGGYIECELGDESLERR